ncbi:hypothetical protein ACFWD7_50410 [Streptomyces mirabilis]|uniref:hypothetical protein n=1 Tax=Streptomyces mirabilis TaxID=68239 RepID=UPI0028F70A7A|nr:hypothetical protein [Streptomyces mirabilis]
MDSDTEEIIAGHASQLSLTDVRELAHAINDDQAVTIEYVAASGSRTDGCQVRRNSMASWPAYL